MHVSVIIVGAGPGGIAVGAALTDKKIDTLILDKGDIGNSWLSYPPETHLLSESSEQKDENAIANIPVSSLLPNIAHPSHVMYKKYLDYVVTRKKLTVATNQEVQNITHQKVSPHFLITTTRDDHYTAQFVVWAAGMYSTPNETIACKGCAIHYSKIQDWSHITDKEIVVVGGANGATEVILQLAKPGRKIRLYCPKPFDIPEPIDCLWKENMQLVKKFELQGLVDIIENQRIVHIDHDDENYTLTSEKGHIFKSRSRPILCIGFFPNIKPIETLIGSENDHDGVLDLTRNQESKKTPNLFVAGTLGKHTHEEAFIRGFRSFDQPIAERIATALSS